MADVSIIFQHIKRFTNFYWKSKTKYNVHSPFISTFIDNILEDGRNYYAFAPIEELRAKLKQSEELINIKDFGAGSLVNQSKQRTVRDVASNSAIPARVAQVLFKLIHHYKPQTCIELGTSLGVSTLYQASAHQDNTFYTLEGCPETAALATKHIKSMGLKNVKLRIGPFEETLPLVLEEMETLDYIYMDGDHRSGASMRYFELCLPKLNEKSIVILADNHWSDDMEKGWEMLKAHPKVTLSIDLYDIGIAFFDPSFKEKQHYNLIPAKYKPWKLGVFN